MRCLTFVCTIQQKNVRKFWRRAFFADTRWVTTATITVATYILYRGTNAASSRPRPTAGRVPTYILLLYDAALENGPEPTAGRVIEVNRGRTSAARRAAPPRTSDAPLVRRSLRRRGPSQSVVPWRRRTHHSCAITTHARTHARAERPAHAVATPWRTHSVSLQHKWCTSAGPARV